MRTKGSAITLLSRYQHQRHSRDRSLSSFEQLSISARARALIISRLLQTVHRPRDARRRMCQLRIRLIPRNAVTG